MEECYLKRHIFALGTMEIDESACRTLPRVAGYRKLSVGGVLPH